MEKGEKAIEEEAIQYYKKALCDREINKKKIADDFINRLDDLENDRANLDETVQRLSHLTIDERSAVWGSVK
jgi:hypothetical protein